MEGLAGVPYGHEIIELLLCLSLIDGLPDDCSKLNPRTALAVEGLAVLRARQVGRFYLNACGLREGPAKPSPFNPDVYESRS